MHKVFTLISGLLFLSSGSVWAATEDTLLVAESTEERAARVWELQGRPGTFEPAGWRHAEAAPLTRVQAVRAGLEVNAYIDERFDPLKGKLAVLRYFGDDPASVSEESTAHTSYEPQLGPVLALRWSHLQ